MTFMNGKSEKDTTKVGKKISPLIGLDAHKCSVIAFCVNVISYDCFEELMTLPSGVSPYEGDGSLRGRRRGRKRANCPRSGLRGMMFWAAMNPGGGGYPAMPGRWSLSFMGRLLRAGLPCLHVKVC
ncbi:MAG: hypothetical protein ACXQTS_06030 [Candidatus Methanospirareceae archaeon]